MIRRWLITLALIIVVPLAVYLFVSRPRVLSPDECSELYRQYAECQDINATYIKDYRVNDTLTLCATVLEATTDSSWTEMLKMFNATPFVAFFANQLESGLDALVYIPSSNALDGVMADEDFAVLSLKDKYACVIYIDDPEIRDDVIKAIMDKIFNSINNKLKFKEQ